MQFQSLLKQHELHSFGQRNPVVSRFGPNTGVLTGENLIKEMTKTSQEIPLLA